MKYFSTFSGIAGFELGIQQAYETMVSNKLGKNRGGEKDKERKSKKGKGLQSPLNETTQNNVGRNRRDTNNIGDDETVARIGQSKKQQVNDNTISQCARNTRTIQNLSERRDKPDSKNGCPTCVGYSEIDTECSRCEREGRGKNQPKTLVSKTKVKCDTCGAEKECPTIQIYEKHFPNHKNYGDITKIIASEIPDHDLFVGGFPCQSFSIAGKRGGFKDTRGTLFFDIARIIKVKRPKNILLENVKGLLSHDKGNTFATIISTIDELGYDCQWQVLNSKNFGVPQNRERVFIIGHLRGETRPKVFPLRKSDEVDIDKEQKLPEQISNTLRTNYSKGYSNETYVADFRNDEGLRIRKDFISPNLTTRRHSETDVSTMPPIIIGGTQKNATIMKDQSPALTEAMGKGGGHTPIVVVGKLDSPTWRKRHESTRRVYGIDGISPTIPTGVGGGVMPKIEVRPILTPDRPNKRQQGRRFKKDGEPSFTITGQDKHGVMIIDKKGKKKNKDYASTLSGGGHSGGNHSDMDLLSNGMKIRRLTPVECERLQGFPDGWTKYGIDKDGNEVEISDTQRYKVLGNAVTVNVIKAIMEKLL